jgi:predicted flap endonuclease-1-like 5' DNA nuclease
MQYLIATYWMWFVVALLVGGVVGYWLRWRFGAQKGSSQVLRWGAVAFLIGLVVAGLHWLPQRPGLYLETLLLLSFWYAVGGLLGALLRSVTSATGSTRAALVGDDLPDSAALARRARAAVKSAQNDTVATVASAGTIEDARLAVEAKATEVTRIVAATKAAHEERIAAEAKAAEAARLAAAAKAAEETRRAIEAKAAEVTRIATAARAAEAARVAAEAKAAEEPRLDAAAKAAEDARVAAEAKAAEEARLAAAAKAAEDARVAAEAKAAEEARIAAAAKAAEDARVAAEARAAEGARLAAAAKAAADAHVAAMAKAAEDARLAAAAKAAEDARRAAEAKAAEKARPGAAAKPAKKARLAAEARIAEGAREAAAKAANDSGVAATAAVAGVETSHPGSKPAGIAAPAQGEADDLTWIKGIGPSNEKACHALGIYQFRQIAMWTPDEAIWVGHHMAFPGRIEREHWIAQARLLASGVETEHARAVKSGSLVVDHTADEPLDEASAALLANSLPEQAAAVEGEDKHAGRRPYGLASALGQPDNLKKIRGIGPQNERRLHALGIWHFAQIAAWSEDNVKWVGSYLAFAGRIDREKWIAQARDLAAGKDTEFSRRVAAGKVATSKDDAASE